ncbi:MAG TPA: hypothetical protein VKU85_13940 [bacterium]|nr:hypothetical protein [bacterium]
MVMATLLNYLFSLGGLVCWILVIVGMFRLDEAVWKRILAILFPPWAFVWGWMRREPAGLGKVMIVWTVCLAGAAISGLVAAPYLAAG